jgi:hypothetical protein
MTTYRPCAEEACGNIVDVNHESKVVRLKLLQPISSLGLASKSILALGPQEGPLS